MPVAILDDRGRLQLPRELRERLGLKPGDAVVYGEVDGEVRLKKAEHASASSHIYDAVRREFIDGKTKPIEQVAAEMGIDLDANGG